MKTPISRRTALKGLGTMVALPWLESLGLAAEPAGPAVAAGVPQRLAFLYVPNGVNMAEWTPKAQGPLTQLPWTLEPLAPVKDELLVLSGLTCDKARPHGDGPGDHARAMSASCDSLSRPPRNGTAKDVPAATSASAPQATRQTRTWPASSPSRRTTCRPSSAPVSTRRTTPCSRTCRASISRIGPHASFPATCAAAWVARKEVSSPR